MCGASDQQKQVFNEQNGLVNDLTNQMQQIFGSSSTTFNDLLGSVAPIVAAGPNQHGFSIPELSALKSQAIEQTGQAYKSASQASKQADAAVGGGNIALPSGASIGRNLSIANSAAAQKSSELNQITQADYATGRQNYENAVGQLEGATQVFNPATEAGNAATNSGSAASTTANEISQANNSWMTAVSGALGGIAGAATSFGLGKLAKP